MVVIHQEKVVKITSYVFRGFHRSINIKLIPVRKSGEGSGKRLQLNAGCQRKLRPHLLLFRCNGSNLLDIGLDLFLHLVDGSCQLSDFIPVFDHTGKLLISHLIFRGEPAGLFRDNLKRMQ